MNIKPSAAIRQNYNEIAELCRSTREPVYLTKNGEGDLVVMDIESFTRREKMLKLREELLRVEEERHVYCGRSSRYDEGSNRRGVPCGSLSDTIWWFPDRPRIN